MLVAGRRALIALALVAGAARAEVLAPHPRLIMRAAELARVHRVIAEDAVAREWWKRLVREGERCLTEPPASYRVDEGRLLDVSRLVLRRLYLLGLLYRVTSERRWLDRARRELAAACAWPDWHPAHFLDTAELTHAVAIGYDWLYADLTAGERRRAEGALVHNGLEPGLAFFEHRHPPGAVGPHAFWWSDVDHNWNQVCSGGLTVGALAVADVEPALARAIVDHAVAAIRRPMARYAPDGGWPEGPGYWHYGTGYDVLMLAALASATGDDRGLSGVAGFASTGYFPLYLTGPTRMTFNFADSPEHELDAPELFWLGRRFDHPVFGAAERDMHHQPSPLDLVWFDPGGDLPARAGLPTARLFRGVGVASMRSAWGDPRAVFVAVKGGDNRANHSHLDLGTFVLDADGERWALDLGPDRYGLPGYFDRRGPRYTYYRLSTAGHNTLTLDGANQQRDARAPVVGWHAGGERSHAVVDLSAAYAGAARSARRGVALVGGRTVVVQDELDLARALPVRWAMHTRANVEVAGARAVLTQHGRSLTATLVEPAGARFAVAAAQPPAPETPADGVRRLEVRLPARAGKLRLVIQLEPGAAPGAPQPVAPLASWER